MAPQCTSENAYFPTQWPKGVHKTAEIYFHCYFGSLYQTRWKTCWHYISDIWIYFIKCIVNIVIRTEKNRTDLYQDARWAETTLKILLIFIHKQRLCKLDFFQGLNCLQRIHVILLLCNRITRIILNTIQNLKLICNML